MRKGIAVAVVGFVVGCAASESDDYGQTQSELKGGGRPDPCALVRCAAGTHCESKGKRAECVPDEAPPLTCASVLCIVGTTCVETPSGPQCVPTAASECQTDADCRLWSNYCGGCECLALANGEQAPTCSDPVNCFADPCGFGQVAACVSGQCVVSSGSF